MNRESMLRAWSDIEDAIEAQESKKAYFLEWARQREAFYGEFGNIPISSVDSNRLISLKDRFHGERIFILGNGPSLNRTPLDLLENEFTFVANRAYLLFDRIKWRPSFYTALDWRVVPDIAHEMNLLTGTICFFEERFRGILRDDDDVYWYTHMPTDDPSQKVFSYSIEKGLRGAGSVIGACVQISHYLGFREIYLIGCDLGYKVAPSVIQEGEDRFGNGVKLHLTSTKDDDPNHFDPRYFGKNKRWHDPNVKRMVSGHEQCLKGVTAGGGRIFNATVGGELEVYPRVDFASLFPRLTGSANTRTAVRSVFSQPKEIAIFPRAPNFIMGEFLRSEHAHFDETDAIWSLINDERGFMIDVGAHRGTSCLPFLRSGWSVLAFEPDPQNRAALLGQVNKENLQNNIRIESTAVGAESKSSVPYFRSDVSSGISGLSAFHESHQESHVVNVVALRNILPSEKTLHVHFLKVDTEGHDLFVLSGFPWDCGLPDVIECEFEDAKTIPLGYKYEDVANFLLEKGYVVYVSEWHPIIRYGVRHDWRGLKKYPAALEDSKSWGNLIAFKNEINEEKLLEAIKCCMRAKPATKRVGAKGAAVKSASPEGQARDETFARCELRHVPRNAWSYQRQPESNSTFFIRTVDVDVDTSGLKLMWRAKIRSQTDAAVTFSIARSGGGAYEGGARKANILSGVESEISFEYTFSRTHKSLKLQIEVVPVEQESAIEVEIDAHYLVLYPSLIQNDVNSLNLSEANKLYRSGMYEDAFNAYLKLYMLRRLSMYLFNLNFSAKKLGIPERTVSVVIGQLKTDKRVVNLS